MTTKEILQTKYNKSLLTKKETAQELNISQASLDRLRKMGSISSKRVGGMILFTINEISNFIDA